MPTYPRYLGWKGWSMQHTCVFFIGSWSGDTSSRGCLFSIGYYSVDCLKNWSIFIFAVAMGSCICRKIVVELRLINTWKLLLKIVFSKVVKVWLKQIAWRYWASYFKIYSYKYLNILIETIGYLKLMGMGSGKGMSQNAFI